MNLAFNFHNELFWIQNFLPQNLYKDMYVNIIKTRNKLNYDKSSVGWHTFKEEKENMSNSYGQHGFNQEITNYLGKYHTLLRHQQYINLIDAVFDSHLRKYNYGQHLAWHTDNESKQRKYAATFYFNKTWQESWGGELMFKDKKGSGFIPILGNSLVVIKTGLSHKVCANLKKTHPRFSIQTWINEAIKEVDK